MKAGLARFVMERKGDGKSGDGFEEGLGESGDASLPDSCFYALRDFGVRVTIGLPIRETRIETLCISYDFRFPSCCTPRTAGA